jgi:hypothetical protein
VERGLLGGQAGPGLFVQGDGVAKGGCHFTCRVAC